MFGGRSNGSWVSWTSREATRPFPGSGKGDRNFLGYWECNSNTGVHAKESVCKQLEIETGWRASELWRKVRAEDGDTQRWPPPSTRGHRDQARLPVCHGSSVALDPGQ